MRSATLNPTPTDTPEVIGLRCQVAGLKRQLFGRKSERFAPTPDPQQMHLGQLLGEELPVARAAGMRPALSAVVLFAFCRLTIK